MNVFSLPLNDVSFDDVQKFINERLPENEVIEYKADWPRQHLAPWLCAFANTYGGLIFLGVAADGDEKPTDICGIDDSQASSDNVDGIAFKVTPPLFGLVESKPFPIPGRPGKSVLLIRVRPGAGDVPYSVANTVYIRTNGSKRAIVDHESNHVDSAAVEETLRLARKREECVALRERMFESARKRASANRRGVNVEVAVVPVYPSPRSVFTHVEFESLARRCVLEVQKTPYLSGPFPRYSAFPTRTGDGVGQRFGRFFVECQRFGLIYAAATDDDQLSPDSEKEKWSYSHSSGTQHILGIYHVQELIFTTVTFAARMIHATARNGMYVVRVNVRGITGHTPILLGDNPAMQIHTLDQTELHAEAEVFSTELLKSPVESLTPLINALFYPTHRDTKQLSGQLVRLNILDNEKRVHMWGGEWRDIIGKEDQT